MGFYISKNIRKEDVNLKEVKNVNNKLVCKIDEKTGILQNIYKRQEVKMKLEVGQSINIVRDGFVTQIKRVEKEKYEIKSY